jgi:hypothetical protein
LLYKFYIQYPAILGKQGYKMNKKAMIVSIFFVLIMLGISLTTTVSSNTSSEKKDSPLYRIKTRLINGEKIGKIIEDIKTKFIGGKLYFIPSVLRSFSQTLSYLDSFGKEPYGTINQGICK